MVGKGIVALGQFEALEALSSLILTSLFGINPDSIVKHDSGCPGVMLDSP